MTSPSSVPSEAYRPPGRRPEIKLPPCRLRPRIKHRAQHAARFGGARDQHVRIGPRRRAASAAHPAGAVRSDCGSHWSHQPGQRTPPHEPRPKPPADKCSRLSLRAGHSWSSASRQVERHVAVSELDRSERRCGIGRGAGITVVAGVDRPETVAVQARAAVPHQSTPQQQPLPECDVGMWRSEKSTASPAAAHRRSSATPHPL